MKFILVIALSIFAFTNAHAADPKPAKAAASKTEGDFAAEATETIDTTPPAPATTPAAKAPSEAAKPATASEAAAPTTTATSAPAAGTSDAPAAQPPAAEKAKGKFEGMYTFDWKKLSKCQIVGPITNAMLTDPKNICKKADRTTGDPASCKISEKSEYLIFKTLEDCKVELDEQLKASP